MRDLLDKLAAIIEWCEQHAADEPHKLACKLKEILEAMADDSTTFIAQGWKGEPLTEAPEADHVQARLDVMSLDGLVAGFDAIFAEEDHIHPDQAVS